MVCTKEDLDPEEGQPLQMVEATLDAYTFLLKHELDIDTKVILTQWLPIQKETPQLPTPAPTTKSTPPMVPATTYPSSAPT